MKTVKIRWRLRPLVLPCLRRLGLLPLSKAFPLLLNRGATLIAHMSITKERFEMSNKFRFIIQELGYHDIFWYLFLTSFFRDVTQCSLRLQ